MIWIRLRRRATYRAVLTSAEFMRDYMSDLKHGRVVEGDLDVRVISVFARIPFPADNTLASVSGQDLIQESTSMHLCGILAMNTCSLPQSFWNTR